MLMDYSILGRALSLTKPPYSPSHLLMTWECLRYKGPRLPHQDTQTILTMSATYLTQLNQLIQHLDEVDPIAPAIIAATTHLLVADHRSLLGVGLHGQATNGKATCARS